MVRSDYKFSNSRADIERLIKKKPEFREVLDRAFADAKFARETFADSVDWVSGWGHNYCCPDCASQMIFDINMPYNPPNVFTCKRCGKTASSIDHDEAWVYYYRTRYVDYLHSCALSAIFGDKESLDFIIRFVDFYADNYEKFPVHGKHAGRGKITEQSLDEAVWAIGVITALKVCGDLIPEEKKTEWMDKLFRPMVELIMPQSNMIHNIQTWHKCSFGVIGIYFGDDELLDHALNSEFGLRNQIKEGFTADGIWYEGSMTYHNYTVSALSGFFAFYAEKNPEDKIFENYAKMNTTLIDLSFDGKHLPALNDGWYPVGLMGVNLTANRVCDDKTLIDTYKELIEINPRQVMNVKGMLFLPLEDDVKLYADTRLAVIKRPFHVLFKAGVIARSHMHSDCLSVRISPFSDDLGTPGYGHELTKRFYRHIASHNSVAVDQGQPPLVPVTSMERVDGGVKAAVCEWEDLTRADRTLTVEGESVCDVTVLSAPTEHTYDWFFHSIGKAEYSAEAECEVETLGEDKAGYAYITDIKKMKTNGTFKATFTLDNGDSLTLEVPSTEGIEVYTAKTPDNPADNKRSTVVLRRTAKEATFEVKFTVKKA